MPSDLLSTHSRNIPLSEMIASLRREIELAQSYAQKENIRFRIPEIELELTMKIIAAPPTQEGEKSSLQFLVLTEEIKGEETPGQKKDEIIHTFKLKLQPEDISTVPSGGPVKVSDEAKERPE